MRYYFVYIIYIQLVTYTIRPIHKYVINCILKNVIYYIITKYLLINLKTVNYVYTKLINVYC